jgi:hypothetical protein
MLIKKEACAWPNLFRLDHSSFGAVIFNKPSHGLEEGSLELWKYEPASGRWRFLSTPAPNLPGRNRMHCACGMAHDGSLHVLSSGFAIADGRFLQLEQLWHSISHDAGKSWHITRNVAIKGIEARCIPHGGIVCLPDGKLLAAVYRSLGKNKPSNTWCIFSEDKGNSWAECGLIGNGDTNEASIIIAGDALLAAVRTHVDHHTRLFESTTRGNTWQDCGPLTLPMQHPGHLLNIDDGILLLTYGIRNKGLMGIGGRISANRGKTWGAPFLLYRFPDKTTDCGYPSTVMVGEDRLLTGYYTNLSEEYVGYQFGVLSWKLSDFLSPTVLKSISDGKNMTI